MIKIILFIIFLIFALIGSISRIRDTRKIRAYRNYKDMLVAWAEHPRSEFQDDIYMGIAIYIHWTSTVLTGIATIIIIVSNPLNTSWSLLIALPILFLFIINTSSLWGSNLLHPIANLISGNRHYAISEEGILFGDNLYPWNTFSSFNVDTNRKVINIWSSSMPETICFVLAPQTSEKTLKIIEILQKYLSSSVPHSQSIIKRCSFSALMAALSAPFVILAILSLLLPAIIAIIVNCILINFLMLFGAKLIFRYVYGNNFRPALIE